ncbi:DUF1990 family protein [Mumia sp. DW29H23]|uniref:DUF1990 family protein n=1 Tax=Mumia sp. DW29H23 TaxID=3421241 RepID=UPI003D6901F8
MGRRSLSVRRWTGRSLTYPEVGATAGPMPAGYHHADETRVLGSGGALFDAAATRLLTLGMHRAAGNTVVATQVPVVEGAVVVQRLRLGPLRFDAPCQVVAVVDEPARRGFAYGTLDGHPECGEERFEVAIDAEGRVTARIRAFSRQARWFTRLAPAPSRLVQRWMTARYFRALVAP